MPEIYRHIQPSRETPPPVHDFKEGSERIRVKDLSDRKESGIFYRGLPAEDALKGVLGELMIEADRTGGKIGSRDNASLSTQDAIYLSRSYSETKRGQKFMCAIGFNPELGSVIEPSFVGRDSFIRFTGRPKVTEIIIRFAGKKPGRPGKTIHLSPKDFYEWYRENLSG